MVNDLNRNEKKKYGLASALARTTTKFFDLLLVLVIIVALFFAIFSPWLSTNFSISNGLETWYQIEGWRIFLFTFIVFLVFFLYFVLIPFLAQGYTLFSKIAKIRIYSTSLKIVKEERKIFKNIHFLFFVQLVIRETLTTILMSFIILLLGIVALFDKNDVINFLLSSSNDSMNSSTNNIVDVVFKLLFTCAGLINIVLIVNVAFSSRKRSFTDHISNTVVVKMVETFTDEKNSSLNYKNKKPMIKYNLPGEFDPSDIFEKKKD